MLLIPVLCECLEGNLREGNCDRLSMVLHLHLHLLHHHHHNHINQSYSQPDYISAVSYQYPCRTWLSQSICLSVQDFLLVRFCSWLSHQSRRGCGLVEVIDSSNSDCSCWLIGIMVEPLLFHSGKLKMHGAEWFLNLFSRETRQKISQAQEGLSSSLPEQLFHFPVQILEGQNEQVSWWSEEFLKEIYERAAGEWNLFNFKSS